MFLENDWRAALGHIPPRPPSWLERSLNTNLVYTGLGLYIFITLYIICMYKLIQYSKTVTDFNQPHVHWFI
jgi:hypothetical protein